MAENATGPNNALAGATRAGGRDCCEEQERPKPTAPLVALQAIRLGRRFALPGHVAIVVAGLAACDLDTIGIALKDGIISPNTAVMWAADAGALDCLQPTASEVTA